MYYNIVQQYVVLIFIFDKNDDLSLNKQITCTTDNNIILMADGIESMPKTWKWLQTESLLAFLMLWNALIGLLHSFRNLLYITNYILYSHFNGTCVCTAVIHCLLLTILRAFLNLKSIFIL